jgi:hypothetical protein
MELVCPGPAAEDVVRDTTTHDVVAAAGADHVLARGSH